MIGFRNMEKPRVYPTEFQFSGELLKGNFVKPPGTGPFPGICKFHGLPGSPDQVYGFAWQLALAGFAVLTARGGSSRPRLE